MCCLGPGSVHEAFEVAGERPHATAASASGEHDLDQELLTLRGFVDLFSVALEPPGPAGSASPADAPGPHRRLAAKLSSGEEVAQDDVSTWYLTTHHDAMGAHKANWSAALLGSDGQPLGADHLSRERRLGR